MSDLFFMGGDSPPVEPRRRGRPRVSEPLKPVTTWVPPAYLDRLDKLALKHDVSVSKLLCRVIEQALSTKPKP